MAQFKPMLASKVEDFDSIRFPLMASRKLDGIRCVMVGGKAMSRTLKLIPNAHVQAMLSGLPDGLDGELMLFDDEGKPLPFDEITSAVMKRTGTPNFTFCVFDWHGVDEGYKQRYEKLYQWFSDDSTLPIEHLRLLDHTLVETMKDLEYLEQLYNEQGFEGIMLRSLDGPYKYGRSTEKQGFLLKWKRFQDAEAVVISVEELMHNENEAKTNEVGATKRSTAKAGKVAGGTLGALHLRRKDGVEFSIGSGFTAAQRNALWVHHTVAGLLIGSNVKYKFQPTPNEPNAVPRSPFSSAFAIRTTNESHRIRH